MALNLTAFKTTTKGSNLNLSSFGKPFSDPITQKSYPDFGTYLQQQAKLKKPVLPEPKVTGVVPFLKETSIKAISGAKNWLEETLKPSPQLQEVFKPSKEKLEKEGWASPLVQNVIGIGKGILREAIIQPQYADTAPYKKEKQDIIMKMFNEEILFEEGLKLIKNIELKALAETPEQKTLREKQLKVAGIFEPKTEAEKVGVETVGDIRKFLTSVGQGVLKELTFNKIEIPELKDKLPEEAEKTAGAMGGVLGWMTSFSAINKVYGTILASSKIGSTFIRMMPNTAKAVTQLSTFLTKDQLNAPLEATKQERAKIFYTGIPKYIGWVASGQIAPGKVYAWLPTILGTQFASSKLEGKTNEDALKESLTMTAIFSIFKIGEATFLKNPQQILREQAAQILKVKPNATTAEVQKAFHTLSHTYKPFGATQEQFKVINNAYQILTKSPDIVQANIFTELKDYYNYLRSPEGRRVALSIINDIPIGLTIKDVSGGVPPKPTPPEQKGVAIEPKVEKGIIPQGTWISDKSAPGFGVRGKIVGEGNIKMGKTDIPAYKIETPSGKITLIEKENAKVMGGVIPEVKPTPPELQPLAQEARKVLKDVEDLYVGKLKEGKVSQIIQNEDRGRKLAQISDKYIKELPEDTRDFLMRQSVKDLETGEIIHGYDRISGGIIKQLDDLVEGLPTQAVKGVKAEVLKEEQFLKEIQSDVIKKIQSKLQNVSYIKSITKQEIKSLQEQVIGAIEQSDLELADKSKFLRTIKNIQTAQQLKTALPEIQQRISSLEEASLKRGIQSRIDKELKYTKPVKLGQRRVGKYDYESNKVFEKLREYNKLTQENAITELSSIPTEGLSEIEKIDARFLSYKVNGAKGSVLLQEQVLADINELKRIGEETKDEADFIKSLEKQYKIDEVLTGIEKQKKTNFLLKGAKEAYISSISNLYSALNTIAGKGIADKYDYGYLQTNSQYAFDAKVELVKNKAKEIYDVKSDRQLSKLFLDELVPTDFEITSIDRFTEKIGKLDLMNIYNGLKNDLVKERFHNAFGEEQVNSLLQNLSPEDMKMADNLMKEVQEYKEILNKRNIEISGRDLGTIENYWPAKSEFQQEFFDDIRIQGEIPSAMKARSKSSKIIPQQANAWLIFQRHIAQAEHIKNLSGKYEELKNIFSDRRIRKTIEEKYGENTYNALIDHIETFSLNQRTQRLDVFSGVYNKALNNWVKAKVASPTVFARQLISSIYSVEEIGIKNFVKYQADFVKNPTKAFKFMWENVPFIKARFKKGYSEALQDVLRGTNNLNLKVGGISKYTTIATRGGDITAIILNGYPIIKTELAKGKSMEQAIETFQRFTEKTQQSPTQANLSSLQRQKNAFARTFFRFKNTVNQLLRLQVDANVQFLNKQITAKQFAEKTFLYSIYTPMMYVLIGFMITQGFKWIFGKEDEEKQESLLGDILQQIIIQPFQSIPLIDATTEVAYSEIRKRITGKDYYLGEGLFSFPLLGDLSTVAGEFQEKDISAEEWLKIFSIIQEPATGLPTETIKRYWGYATKEEKESSLFKLPELPSLPKLPKLPKLPSLPKLPKI